MMLELKDYQNDALGALDTFFAHYREDHQVDLAYRKTAEPLLNRQPLLYFPAPKLPGVPYVCIRLPTGGGKTLIAAHAVGRISRNLLKTEGSLTIWLAPTDQIVSDTLRALQTRIHPYRQALDSGVTGEVRVMDLREALSVRRSDLDGNAVVIVATIASLRVEDTTGRRVYSSNGTLQHHFAGLTPEQLKVFRGPEANGLPGPVEFSLANVIRLRRPIVIVDEAHNANTPLSFDTLVRLDPSCILEFTATPNTASGAGKTPSNVLYNVSAARLKLAQMIKVPVKLTVHPNWQDIVGKALAWRDRLEQNSVAEMKLTGEYIRPIILYQAQAKSQVQETVTPELLRHHLIEQLRIPAEQVKVATGELNEIKDLDLSDPECPVRHVITVQALREGWDCPFAYVLCSVATQKSQTAIEQLIGRVLRLPNARTKQTLTLNHSYVFAVSNNLAATLNKLSEGLIGSGYTPFDARRAIDPQPLFGEPAVSAPPTTITLEEPLDLTTLSAAVQSKIVYDATTLTLALSDTQQLNVQEINEVLQAAPALADQIAIERLTSQMQASPAERGIPFEVPTLNVREQGGVVSLFDSSVLIEGGWSLDQAVAELTSDEYQRNTQPVQQGMIDIGKDGKVVGTTTPLVEAQAMLIRAADPALGTAAELALWLDQAFRHEDLNAQESRRFLARVLNYLTGVRNIPLEDLIYDRFKLMEAVKQKIKSLKLASRKRAYSALLPGLVVEPDQTFRYPPEYPATTLYDGTHRFSRHYYRVPGDLKSTGEEFEAAVMLDGLPQVRFWVRNLTNRPQHSFWLQTSTDRAYPDFMVMLHSGVVVAIEYKGEHLVNTPDTQEKQQIGELWAAASGGRARYLLLRKADISRLDQLL